MSRSRVSIRLSALLSGLLVSLGLSSAQADVVRLHQGGELRGELLPDPAADGPVSVKTRSGTVITLSRDSVEFIKRRSTVVEEYVTRSRQIPETVEAHLELAEWCRAQMLTVERREQLEAVLEIEPDHAEVRRILGYEKHFGRWMTRDDLMTERGYVRHKGKWITRQEFDLIEKTAARRDAEQVWYPKVRLWVGWATGANLQKQADGIRELQRIRDPNAVAGLASAMEEHADVNVRLLFVGILREIDGLETVQPLIERCLMDEQDSVRRAALEALDPDHYQAALPTLLKALKHPSNPVVCRAAQVLGAIGDARSVPSLIDALVTAHTVKVDVPVSNAISMGTVNGRTGMLNPGAVTNGIPYDIDAMARTGQLPYGYKVLSDPHIPRRTKTVSVKVELKNDAVLAALQTLTGSNFGFNQRDWQLWWALQKG